MLSYILIAISAFATYGKKIYFIHPAGICLIKVKSGNTRIMCEICSKLALKTPKPHRDAFLVSLLLILNRFIHWSDLSTVDFEQEN